MQIYYNQLDTHLKDKLLQKYLISSPDIFLEEKCCDMIKETANSMGYIDKEIYYVDKSFDWSQINDSINTMSLFLEKKIIEIRFTSSTIDQKSKDMILEYLNMDINDVILLVRTPVLKSYEYKKEWTGKNNSTSGLIRLFTLNKKEMRNEIISLSSKYNFNLDNNCIDLLCDLYENNLLSASQALLKISLTCESTNITVEDLHKMLFCDSQYEASNLFDYSILSQTKKIKSCIEVLKTNRTSLSYIIWTFIRQFHTHSEMISQCDSGKNINDIVKNIWPYEKKNITKIAIEKLNQKKIESYISLLIRIDMQSKGIIEGNPWDSIYDLCISMSKNNLSMIKYN